MSSAPVQYSAKYIERFLARVDRRGPDECWLWMSGDNGNGYGSFYHRPEGSKKPRSTTAHRIAYAIFVGPIPRGLEVDHLCNVRRCVNPAHLEAVTREENIARAVRRRGWTDTHCPHGHPLDENLYINPKGDRVCRRCACLRVIAHYRRKREARAA